MAEKIKESDIFSGDLTGKAIKEFEALIKVLERLEEQQKDNLKVSSEGLKINAKEYDDVKKNIKIIGEQEKLEALAEKTRQEKVKTEKQLQDLANKKLTTQQKEIALAEKKRKIAESSARAELKLTGAYDKQSKRLNELRKQYKNLIVEQGKETNATRKMRKEMQKLDRQLKNVDASAGQFQRSVGNYGKALGGLKSLGSAVLPVAGITGLVTVMGNAVKVFRDFEKANSGLKAVSGATDEEMRVLSDTARTLGSVTQFTASEVVGLQTEFAKLGFTVGDIENATKATLDLASASGTDLAESASVLGNTLGGFGLDAIETQRVVDIMAKSFSTSALDMEKFKESMKLIAPVAKAVGVSVEDTTAMLGTLANSGISGSSAGTALRGSFLQLKKAGLSLKEGLDLVNKSSDKTKTALDLVGKNASSAFLILANGTETTKELADGFREAEGSAQAMADVKLDNLAGDVTKLGSAWEGFILGIEDGTGSLARFARSTIQFISYLLTQLEKLASGDEAIGKRQGRTAGKDIVKAVNEESKSIENEEERRANINKILERKLSVYKELQEIEEKSLKGIDESIFNSEGTNLKQNSLGNTKGVILEIEMALANLNTEAVKSSEIIKDVTSYTTSDRGDKIKKTGKRDLVKDQPLYEAFCKSQGGKWDKSNQTCKFEIKDGLDVDTTFQESLCTETGGVWDKSNNTCSFEINVDAETKSFSDYQEILTELVDRQTQKRIDLIDKEIEANENRQSVLQELAGKGIQDAKENLAEEKKQQAELEREKERALKRQQRLELGLAVLNSYSNNIDNGVENPLAKTITDTSVLLSFIQSLPTFYEGTENTGTGGQLDNKGGFHAVLHPNERVMTAEQNNALDGLSNWELSNLGKQYKQGNLNPVLSVDNSDVVNKLDQLVNKPTYLGKDYDSTEKAIIDVIAKKGRIERNHKKTGKNLF